MDQAKRTLALLLLMAVQVMVVNHIHLMGCVTPLIIGYLLICFHAGTSRTELLCWGFAEGLIYDIFSDTMGIGAASCTLLALLQPMLLKLFKPREAQDDFEPSINSMGASGFLTYAAACLLVLHTAFYLLDSFSFAHILTTLIAITGSTALATVLTAGMELLIRQSPHESKPR